MRTILLVLVTVVTTAASRDAAALGKTSEPKLTSGEGGTLAKRLAVLGTRLRPLLGARRSGAMTASDFEARRLRVLGDLGLIPPALCATRGKPYACARSNVLPEPLVQRVKSLPAARTSWLDASPDAAEAFPVTAVVDGGRRVPFVYVTGGGEIVKLFYDAGQCVGWNEGKGTPIPLDVARIQDIEPASAPPPDGSGTLEVPTNRFDPVAAHSMLDTVDLSACWPRNAVHGYGKARVTFAPDGSVELVDVAGPAGAGPRDDACIEQAFGGVFVAPFEGPRVTATTTFHVGPGGVDWREQRAGGAVGPRRSCAGSARAIPEPVALSLCSARGVSYPCVRSNVLPGRIQRKVKQLPRSHGLPDAEVGAYGDAGPVSTRPVRVTLADGGTVGFVYVAEKGEIVKIFYDRDQTWWTEGDDGPIPFDVGSVSDASPSQL